MEHSVLEQAMQALNMSDQEILRLLTLRAQLVAQLSQAWIREGEPMRMQERMTDIVSRLLRRNAGPLDDESLTRLFKAVIQATEPPFTSLSTHTHGGKKS